MHPPKTVEVKQRQERRAQIPSRCPLCDAKGEIFPAKFRQVYPQNGSPAVLLDWWECFSCRGWFVSPVPTPRMIEQYWKTVAYTDPEQEVEISQDKQTVCRQILAELARWTAPGPLLDFGCNSGHFLLMAREAGWVASGFDANVSAVERARAKGFDVRCGWSLDEAGFAAGHFAAITAIDVFCYVWDPITTLKTFHRLLKPGGVLALRLTNKRLVLGLTRALSKAGATRDTRLSQLLQAQFHSISLASLTRIMKDIGFNRILAHPHATTAPWSALKWHTRSAYLLADMAYFLSLSKLNVSPGILFFAQKP